MAAPDRRPERGIRTFQNRLAERPKGRYRIGNVDVRCSVQLLPPRIYSLLGYRRWQHERLITRVSWCENISLPVRRRTQPLGARSGMPDLPSVRQTRKMPSEMILTFLGTAAANAFPEAFCKCPNCIRARMLAGPSLRKRAAALINDDLLIDLGPDIESASQIHQCSLGNVQYCLQTHPHADHLDLSHLLSRSSGFGVVGAPVLNFYASRETWKRAAEIFAEVLADYSLLSSEAEERLNFKIHEIQPLEPLTVGPYRVVPFPANHAPGMGATLYSVEANGRTIFYGTDTAPLSDETWQAFSRRKVRFDCVVLDHTYGPEQRGEDHLNAHQLIEHAQRMRAQGMLAPNARIFATHIAHEGNPAHPDLVAFAQQHGYEVAYDGLILPI